jgi:mannitol/fructose-specific phosphotransferase system IIA component (Ntr-type)
MLMLPQAGVAAVEAFFVASVLGKDGQQILGIIIPGLIVFELLGVLISERTLLKWRSWETGGGDLLETQEDRIRKQLKKEKLSLPQLLSLETLRVPFEVTTKGGAIWQLIQVLKSAGAIEDPGKVLEIILQRERQGGITLGEGIAILHGRLPHLQQPVVALGILPEGQSVIFEGEMDEAVTIIYMVLSPTEKPELHLQVLASIAKLLSNPEARQKLHNASDEIAALEIIKQYS